MKKGERKCRLWFCTQADGPLRAGMVGGVVGHHLLEGIVFCQGLALPVGTMHRARGQTGPGPAPPAGQPRSLGPQRRSARHRRLWQRLRPRQAPPACAAAARLESRTHGQAASFPREAPIPHAARRGLQGAPRFGLWPAPAFACRSAHRHKSGVCGQRACSSKSIS